METFTYCWVILDMAKPNVCSITFKNKESNSWPHVEIMIVGELEKLSGYEGTFGFVHENVAFQIVNTETSISSQEKVIQKKL